MCAQRVQYDGGGPLESRRYVERAMSGRVEEYGGERGRLSLARSKRSDWRGPGVRGRRWSTNCREKRIGRFLRQQQ